MEGEGVEGYALHNIYLYLQFDGTTVYIKKMGNAVILIPEKQSWQALFGSLELFLDDFLAERIQPAFEPREGLFE